MSERIPTTDEVAKAAREMGRQVDAAFKAMPALAAKAGAEIASIPIAWKQWLDKH